MSSWKDEWGIAGRFPMGEDGGGGEGKESKAFFFFFFLAATKAYSSFIKGPIPQSAISNNNFFKSQR